MFLCFYNTGQAADSHQKVGMLDNITSFVKSTLSHCPSPLKSSSSAKIDTSASLIDTNTSFSDDEDDFVAGENLSRKSTLYIPPDPESVSLSRDAIFSRNSLTIDAFPCHLFCRVIEASEQRYIYPDFFFNPHSVVDQSYPLSVVELYAPPLPSMAATVESFSLLPRDDPNSKA